MSCPDKIGPRGPMGFQGPKGDTGASGLTGPQGARGLTGAQGLVGAKGDKGDTGDKGDKGDTGLTGAAGVPGKDGEVGTKGQDGLAGIQGDQGEQGVQGDRGATGPQGQTGAQGLQGENGRYIIGTYASLTGIGNTDVTGDETPLFSQNLAGNTLVNDGDEIELTLSTEYFANDLVNLIFQIDPTNRYVYAYQLPDNDIRTIKILITRVDATTQMWNIEDICKDLVSSSIAIKTLDTFVTNFDLSKPMTFQILADNTVIGADQVLLKKCSMYLNKR